MISHQLALIRREILEHKAIWVTPAVIAVIVLFSFLTGQMTISAYGGGVDLAIAGASNADPMHRRVAMMAALGAITSLFAAGAGIVMIFYSLDALYAERKDKSILFWRSLPITDAETVISKVLTALLVIPLAAVLMAFATHIMFLVMSSIWLMAKGGDAGHLIWSSAPVFDVFASSLITAIATSIWMSPFIGWFFFVSAYTRRMPLLMAGLPLIILPLLEIMILPTELLAKAIGNRFISMPLTDIDFKDLFDEDIVTRMGEDNISMIAALDVGRFISSPAVWAGLVVCGLFVTAAIYVRRYRDDS
jgi:ABC-2 type transport system permease protein